MNTLRPQTLLYTERGTTWINNFPLRDRETARWLINGLTLVSLSNFSRTIQRIVTAEASAFDGPIALFSIREVTSNISYFQQTSIKDKSARSVSPLTRSADIGSEGHVASIIRQFAKGNHQKFMNHPTIGEMRRRKCRAILVIDDLIASGNRTRKFLDAIWLDQSIRSWWSLGYISLRAIAYSSISQGMQHVTRAKYKPAVVVDRTCPTYPELPWPRSRREAISNLCRTYGNHTSKPAMAMGYKRTMAAMVFEHGCPNNTPAILWAGSGKHKSWHPIFPQRSIPTDTQTVFPPEIVRRDPISVLIDAGQTRLAKTGFRRIGHIGSRQAFTLLALLSKGLRRNEALTFSSGLSNSQVERLLQKYISWGLVTPTRRITQAGLDELEHARRLLPKAVDVAPISKESYYPTELRGPTGG